MSVSMATDNNYVDLGFVFFCFRYVQKDGCCEMCSKQMLTMHESSIYLQDILKNCEKSTHLSFPCFELENSSNSTNQMTEKFQKGIL